MWNYLFHMIYNFKWYLLYDMYAKLFFIDKHFINNHSINKSQGVNKWVKHVSDMLGGSTYQLLLTQRLKVQNLGQIYSMFHHFVVLPPYVQLNASSFTALPLFWTSASKRGFELSDVVRLLSKRTAQLCSLDSLKGSLTPGYDADLVMWDPERLFQVSKICNSIYTIMVSLPHNQNHYTTCLLTFSLSDIFSSC